MREETQPADGSVGANKDTDGDAWMRAVARVGSFTPGFIDARGAIPSRPDIVCIGAQKAGTTWLYNNLACHPLVFTPPIKEISYFSTAHIEGARKDNLAHRLAQTRDSKVWWETQGRRLPGQAEKLALIELLASTDVDDAWYRAIFAYAKPDQIGIDISPAYCLLPRQGIRHLLAINPNVRIAILLRDPVERLVSQAIMLKRSAGDGASVREIIASDAFFTLAAFSDYGKWVLRWLGMLGRERVFIEYLPNVARRPLSVLASFCAFAGLPFDVDFFPAASQPVFQNDFAIGDYEEAYLYAKEKLAPLVDDFQQRLPDLAEGLRRAAYQTF